MQKKTEETSSNRKGIVAEYLTLFWEFFKIGAFTIGGGAAMIPQMQQIAVEDKGWLSEEEMLDCIAMGQSLPGVIAVNMATFIGYKRHKTFGAFVATFGVVIPAFLAILIAVLFLDQIGENGFVQGAFMGVKAAVCGLILVTAIKLLKKIDVFTIVMAVGALVCVAFLGVEAVWVILASIVIGIIYNSLRVRRLAGEDDSANRETLTDGRDER